MNFIGYLVRWLGRTSPPEPSEAIFVLDGGEGGNRLSTGLRLLRAGYAPWLLVSRSLYYLHDELRREEDDAKTCGDRVIWSYHDGASTRDEAEEALRQLKRLRLSSVLVVTSSYHLRRTRILFRRVLEPAGIRLRMVAAPLPVVDGHPWAGTRTGLSVILFELVKLAQVWLRLDWKLPPAQRLRLAAWLHRMIYALSPRGWAGAAVGAGEGLVLNLSLPDASRAFDDSYLTASLAAAARNRLEAGGDRRAGLEQAGRPMIENEASTVEAGNFRAVNVVAEESGGFELLAAAFNTWVEETRPAAIVHVHHFRDSRNHRMGYQIIYAESAAAVLEAEEEERRAA